MISHVNIHCHSSDVPRHATQNLVPTVWKQISKVLQITGDTVARMRNHC